MVLEECPATLEVFDAGSLCYTYRIVCGACGTAEESEYCNRTYDEEAEMFRQLGWHEVRWIPTIDKGAWVCPACWSQATESEWADLAENCWVAVRGEAGMTLYGVTQGKCAEGRIAVYVCGRFREDGTGQAWDPYVSDVLPGDLRLLTAAEIRLVVGNHDNIREAPDAPC